MATVVEEGKTRAREALRNALGPLEDLPVEAFRLESTFEFAKTKVARLVPEIGLATLDSLIDEIREEVVCPKCLSRQEKQESIEVSGGGWTHRSEPWCMIAQGLDIRAAAQREVRRRH